MRSNGNFINFDQFHDTEAIKNKAMASAAVGGPNSGFEIEGMDLFKDPQLTQEFPELKDDIALIVSTEAFVAKLVDFRRRVHAHKGMSRGMAHELLELVPSLESHTSPMHFTEEITSIGCEMSLEAIDIKLWAIIAAAIAFVAALIYKFIDWLGFGGGGSGGSGDLEKAKEGIKEADKKLANQEHAISETVKLVKQNGHDIIEVEIPNHLDLKAIEASDLPDPLKKEVLRTTRQLGAHVLPDPNDQKHHIKVKVSDVLADIEGGAAVYDYIRKPNKWARIIYQDRNRALNLVLSSFEAFETGSNIVLHNLALMNDVIEDMEKLDNSPSVGDKMASNMRVGSYLNTLQSTLLTDGEFKVGGHAYQTMGHWALEVKEATNDQSEYRSFFTDLEDLLVSHEVAIRRLRHVRFNNVLVFIEALEKAKPILQRFDKIAHSEEARERMGLADAARAERAEVLMKLAKQMSRNFNSLMTVYAIISKVYEEASKHGTMIVEKLRSNAKKIVTFYNTYGEHPPPTLIQLVEKLEEQLRFQREAEIKARMLPASAFVSMKDVGRTTVTVTDSLGNDIGSADLSFNEAQSALKTVLDTSGQTQQ